MSARARAGKTRGLALMLATLAVASAVAVAVGLLSAKPGLVVIGLPLTLLYGFGAWLLDPRRIETRPPQRRPDRMDRFFERLGIPWFLDPHRHERWPKNPEPNEVEGPTGLS
jgi:hypothetical protein